MPRIMGIRHIGCRGRRHQSRATRAAQPCNVGQEESEGGEAGLKTRLYFVVLSGSGAGVAQGMALKFASFGSRLNDVLV